MPIGPAQRMWKFFGRHAVNDCPWQIRADEVVEMMVTVNWLSGYSFLVPRSRVSWYKARTWQRAFAPCRKKQGENAPAK
ncbi:MAG: hypothetical protein Q8P39_00745 [Candidatus Yanofskybacteria bacterium]|nr:hypothetical protein [Candidatus Yanofskybacteria bacterium]